MIVQRVVMPTTATVSFTVLGDDLAPIEPAEAYLAHLSGVERSPNTVRAYAHSLKLWLEFLALHEVGWDAADMEDVSRFVPMTHSTGASRLCSRTTSAYAVSAESSASRSPVCSASSVWPGSVHGFERLRLPNAPLLRRHVAEADVLVKWRFLKSVQISLNSKLGVLKRIAYGFKNPRNFEARALLICPAVA